MATLGPPALGFTVPFTVPFAVLFAVALGLGVGVGLLAGAGPRARVLGVGLAVLTMPLPFFLPPERSLSRFVLGLAAILAIVRGVDFLRGARLETPLRRVWFALTPFDVRQTSRAAPALDGSRLVAALGFGGAAVASWLVLTTLAPRVQGPAGYALRWGVGLVLAYTMLDAVVASLHVGYRLVGVALPDFHRAPILSQSLQEFWGLRWNRPVHEWLSRHWFAPFARKRKPLLGVTAAFVGSTLLHLWLAFVSVPLLHALAMGAFFVVHGLLVVLERWLGVQRWRPPLGRAWTIACFLLSGPLFVEPALRAVL